MTNGNVSRPSGNQKQIAVIRTVINAGVPILLYAPGAVEIMQTKWGDACKIPCTIIFTQPIEQTFSIAKAVAGIAGESLLAILVIVWILNFVNQMPRGMHLHNFGSNNDRT